MKIISIKLTLNGKIIGPVDVPENTMMIHFLHEHLNMTGTKFGCGAGICHACVILEKTEKGYVTHRTCIIGVASFNDKNLVTIEGHASLDEKTKVLTLHPVQQAFVDGFSFQCGWCTSGFVNEAIGYYESLKNSPVLKSELRSSLESVLGAHVCRCTGYVKYYEALEKLILSEAGLTQ